MGKIKIIIVDDVEMTRVGLSYLIKKHDNLEMIAEAENGRVFLNLLNNHKPDIVLMDVNMLVMNGIDATREAVKINPDLKIIALTNDDGGSSIEEMITAGAKGFLMKNVGSAELLKSIEVVINGGTYFSSDLVSYYNRALIDDREKNKILLTSIESKVLDLLCQGFSIKEIADKLFVTPDVIQTQCNNLAAKTKTRNAVGLVLYAIKNKMVSLKYPFL